MTNLSEIIKNSNDTFSSTNFYKAVIDQSANLILLSDPSGVIIYVNERFQQLSKYSENELLGHHTRINKSGEQSALFYRNMWKTINDGKVFRGQFKNRAKDGSFYWLETTITPLKDKIGNIIAFLSVSENITYQNILDERYSISIEFYKRLIRHLPHTGIILTTDSDVVSLAEGEVISLLTLKTRLNIGQKSSLFFDEVGLGQLNKDIAQVFKENRLMTRTIEVLNFSFRIQLIPMPNVADTPNHVLVLLQDITEYTNLLRDSMSNQKRLEAMFSNAGAGVAILDRDGFFKQTNGTWDDLIGHKIVYNLEIRDVVHSGDYLPLMKSMVELENGVIDSYRGEIRVVNKQKEVKWIDLSMTSMFDEKLNQQLMIIIATDIDEAKKSKAALIEREQLLEEMNRTKDKFFSILSHDLRNPFNSLVGFSEYILESFDTLKPQEIKDFVTIMRDSAENTLELLENLLDWSRSQQGKIEWHPKAIDVRKMSEIAIRQVSSASEKKEITIENRIDNAISAFFDPNMISTVIRNIVSNGVKFSNRGSKIIINSVVENDKVVLSFEDFGKGIPPENMEKLFKVGQLESESGTENELGTGLGLILCKEFVEINKGKIWVQSELGKGSTFFFSIPKQ